MHLCIKQEMFGLLETWGNPNCLFALGRETGDWDVHWPKMHVKSILLINLDYLVELGILLLCVDLDKTLIDKKSDQFSTEIIDWFRRAKSKGLKIVIGSNTVTLSKELRLSKLAKSVDVRYISIRVRISCWLHDLRLLKPNPYVVQQSAAMIEAVSSMNQVAMIGDQATRDTAAGNRAGAYSILVDPIGRHGFWTYIDIRKRIIEIRIRRIIGSYYGAF